ncbi:MAG: glycosyltransferase family 4 protein [Micrococcus sp.]|nr:glycosyltransferase family 4 protein [Micrococcus sp.]
MTHEASRRAESLRACLLIHTYLPTHSPPQRRWSTFVSELRAAGWDVDVVTPRAGDDGGARRGPAGERVVRTWRVARIGGRNGRFLSAAVHAVLAIPAAARLPRPDVVVATVPALPMVVPAWVLSRLWRRPLVLEMRDAWPDLGREAGVSVGPLGLAMEWLVAGVQRRADHVVTVTAGFARQLAQRGLRAVTHISNGIDTRALPPIARGPREPGEPLHVLYLGNHGESQGLERLIRAAALIRDSHDAAVHVRLVGEGTRKDELIALNIRLGEPVQFLDEVGPEEAREHYAWADTCLIMLRPDWPSFAWTVPSKTYELLALDLHVTPVVEGEAAGILRDAVGAEPVAAEPEAIAAHLVALAADPRSTETDGHGPRWASTHADLRSMARRMDLLLTSVAEARRTASALCRPTHA